MLIHVSRTLSSTAPRYSLYAVTARAQLSPTHAHGKHYTVSNPWKGFRKDCAIPDRHLNLCLYISLIKLLIEKGTNVNDNTKVECYQLSGYESTILLYKRPNPAHTYNELLHPKMAAQG